MKMSWEWIAGFFEGEGCIQYYAGKNGTKQGECGRALIGQRVKEPLQAIYDFLVEHRFHEPSLVLRPARIDNRGEKHGCIWILTINHRKDVIRFLKEIEPFVFQKKAKALQLIDILTSMDAERDKILEIALRLRQEGATWNDVSKKTGIGRVALLNYAKSAGIDIGRVRLFEDSTAWKQDRVNRGLCENCGNPRGKDGLKRRCRKCADKSNLYHKEWKRNHKKNMIKPE